MIYRYYICMCFMFIYLSSIKIEMKGNVILLIIHTSVYLCFIILDIFVFFVYNFLNISLKGCMRELLGL